MSEQILKLILGDAFVHPSSINNGSTTKEPEQADTYDDATLPIQHLVLSSMLTAHLVSPNTARRSLDFDACYAQVLDSLQKCLQSILDHYLPLCEQDINCKEYGWQNLAPLQQKNNGNTFIAIQQKRLDGLMLLWLDAMLPQTYSV